MKTYRCTLAFEPRGIGTWELIPKSELTSDVTADGRAVIVRADAGINAKRQGWNVGAKPPPIGAPPRSDAEKRMSSELVREDIEKGRISPSAGEKRLNEIADGTRPPYYEHFYLGADMKGPISDLFLIASHGWQVARRWKWSARGASGTSWHIPTGVDDTQGVWVSGVAREDLPHIATRLAEILSTRWAWRIFLLSPPVDFPPFVLEHEELDGQE